MKGPYKSFACKRLSHFAAGPGVSFAFLMAVDTSTFFGISQYKVHH